MNIERKSILSYLLCVAGIAANAEYVKHKIVVERRQLNKPSALELLPNEDIEANGSITALQFNKVVQHKSNHDLICDGDVNLMNMRCPSDALSSDSAGDGLCLGVFCHTNPAAQDVHFVDTANTESCKNFQFTMPIAEAHKAAVECDNASTSEVQALKLEQAAFQMAQSKAAETFSGPLAKALPDKKVISNAAPLTVAMTICNNPKHEMTRTKDCNPVKQAELVEQTLYLMSRDTDPSKNGFVVLFHSDATEAIPIFTKATGGTVPFCYVYGPKELTMSTYPLSIERAPCARHCNKPSSLVKKQVTAHGVTSEHLTPSQCCAASTASNMETALQSITQSNTGCAINNLDLPYALETVIANTWNIDLTETQKQDMLEVAAARDRTGVTFTEYVGEKMSHSTEEIKADAQEFAENLYQQLDTSGNAEGGRRMKKERLIDWPSSTRRMMRTRF